MAYLTAVKSLETIIEGLQARNAALEETNRALMTAVCRQARLLACHGIEMSDPPQTGPIPSPPQATGDTTPRARRAKPLARLPQVSCFFHFIYLLSCVLCYFGLEM